MNDIKQLFFNLTPATLLDDALAAQWATYSDALHS